MFAVVPPPLKDNDPLVLRLLTLATETMLAHPDALPADLVAMLDAYAADLTDALETATNAMPAAAKVHYNPDGTPDYSTDPDPSAGVAGGVTNYGYNSLHQLHTVTPPTSGSLAAVTLTYDGFGRVATVTDGDGNTLTCTYDLADRITQEAYTGGTHTLTVTYGYDGAGNLHTQADASGTTTWTYDGPNMVLTRDAASGGGTLTYGYDADANMTSSADAAGTTTYAYNTRDLLASLTDPAGKLWEFAYNADGQRTRTYYDTNTAQTVWDADEAVSYDSTGRITSIKDYADSGATTLSNVSYCYNTSISGTTCSAAAATDTDLAQYIINNQTSAVSQYSYDDANRLSEDYAAPTSYNYGYDGDGNIKTGSPAGTLTYNTSNQITTAGHAYDGAGNITANPDNGTQAYNDAGQLISASDATGGGGSGTEAFTYAGSSMDQPLSDGSATAITYGQDGLGGQPAVDSYATGSSTDYVIRDQQGNPLGMVRGTSSYMFLTDNIGSVTGITGTCQCNYATYTYDPYGSLTAHTGSYTQNLIRYTGALTDTTTGTSGTTGYIHDGDRWYNTATDNFTTQDANSYLADPGNGNRYAYAADNPINYTDPTGMISFPDFLTTIGIYTGGGAGIGTVAGCATVGVTTGIAGTVIGPEGTILGAVAGCTVGAPVGIAAGTIIGAFVGLGVGLADAF